VSARALAARLAPELDWIVLEAIEKEPGRRYQTVAELAAELDRALRGERVRAVRGGLAYALGKAARRHRRAAVALVIAALALGGGLLAGYLVRQDALASRRVAEERRRLQARVDALYDEYTLPEEVHAQIASDPTLGAAERALAAEIVEARTPPSPRELVGAAWRLVGDPGPSPPAAARALVMAERGLEEDDRLPSHALLLGVCRYRLEEYDEAVRALERAVSLAEEADDGEALAGSLAFLAMSRLLRGELEAALALRARLRDLGEPAREFLGEVEDTFLE
jgi:tetratricopeptide (TPR) repeat protein